LKLNLGVRTARYARFAAVAKTVEDVSNAPDAQAKLRGLALQLANQTGKFETIN
jgi:catalase